MFACIVHDPIRTRGTSYVVDIINVKGTFVGNACKRCIPNVQWREGEVTDGSMLS